MTIQGPGPGSLAISRAYGAPGVRPAGSVAPDAATRLVAGLVDSKVEFSGGAQPSATPAAAAAFRLYTRAADVNEVATGVALGRSIDVAG